MVSTGKERQRNRRLLIHLNDFDQDIFVGDAVSSERQNVVVSGGLAYHEFTVSDDVSNSITKGNTVIVQTLEKCLTDSIDNRWVV